jgi:FtsH-binding integral membrane protein
MSTYETTYNDPALAGGAIEREARELLGQVMGYVAVTVGFAALGAYLGRDLSGATGLVLFIGAFAAIFSLHIAVVRGREQLAIGLLFGMGLLLGLAVAPVIADYASADPSAPWQAAGATAAFVAALGTYGYATRRDLSSWGRTLFWSLLGLIVFGLVVDLLRGPQAAAWHRGPVDVSRPTRPARSSSSSRAKADGCGRPLRHARRDRLRADRRPGARCTASPPRSRPFSPTQ